MKYLAAILALNLTLSLSACGKKGDLMPPPGYGQKATPENGSNQSTPPQTPAPESR